MATILLLALTVTLFASIFAFVTSFPSPPPQNSNQFQATLVYASNQSYITSIKILHLAGPSVSKLGLVYLKSARFPAAPEFQNPIPVAWGINNATTWNLGVTWIWNFPTHTLPQVPDNITVYVVFSSQLLYSVVLPGQVLNVPPAIVSAWTVASAPTAGSAFRIYATISGSLGAHKAYINLGGVPGQSGNTVPMWFNSSLSAWQFNVSAGNTSATPAGSYSGIINVTGSYGQTAVNAVAITLAPSQTGPLLSVAVAMSSTLPQMGTALSLIASVTYSGSTQNAALNVSFYVNQTSPSKVASFVGYGPKSLTISGPATQTVVSTTKWVFPTKPGPRTFTLVASATVGGTLSAQGNLTINSPLGLTPGAFSAAPVTTCTEGTNCPTFSAKLYLNTTSYGAGPFAITYSMYVNYTSNNTTSKGGSQTGWTSITGLTITPLTSPITLSSPSQWHPAKKSISYTVTIVAYVVNLGVVYQNSYTVTPAS